MNRATWMKFIAGVLLFGTWLGLVLARLAPAPALVDAIGYALVGLGIYHAASDGGNIVLKFLAGLLLFGAWLALVARGLTPAAGLIDAIAYTLAGLGVYQATGKPSLVTARIDGFSVTPVTLTGLAGAGSGGAAAMPAAASAASAVTSATADSPAAPVAGADAVPAAVPAVAAQPAPAP
ncbi:hypothetical protein [Burkholderia seminalis]|uniref:hypothetical protein n=1 Tax=Burkholderia seminalis TaxID=488731 RepID=UPI0014540F24|nr:hypothetical protein [Burkholderia seminalis]MCA8430021.1 hypothetical protein [Burkholderia seminalis]VWB15682.1 hypothetical protein BSE24067_00555 [Burkholderia seminalis]